MNEAILKLITVLKTRENLLNFDLKTVETIQQNALEKPSGMFCFGTAPPF